jgi:hypothetical protein
MRNVYVYTLLVIFLTVVMTIMFMSIASHDPKETDDVVEYTTKTLPTDIATTVGGTVGGGWFSNWGAIDNAIRKPRHPPTGYHTDPTQVWYAPSLTTTTTSNVMGESPWTTHVQNTRGTGNPMITSVKKPLALGVWSQIGTGYTTNPADSEVVYLMQKAMDPNRDFYQYKVVNDKGFEIPLDTNVTELKNGSTFTVPGWESKGPFTANITGDGYTFVYV